MTWHRIDVIGADATTTFGVQCDGEKIEQTCAHEGQFIVRQISMLQAMEMVAAYQRCILQMAWKEERARAEAAGWL
jgi:hypothetical protein